MASGSAKDTNVSRTKGPWILRLKPELIRASPDGERGQTSALKPARCVRIADVSPYRTTVDRRIAAYDTTVRVSAPGKAFLEGVLNGA